MTLSRTPTLADVGKVAGVSRGTVSNVFNHPELVRADVRERVEHAARQLGYDGPDPRGRVLRDGKFNAIGFVPAGDYSIADIIGSPFGRALVLGISQVCDAAGVALSMVSGRVTHRTTIIRDALVDGFILGHTGDVEVIRSVQRRRIPFVILESDPGPEMNSIRVDGGRGAYLLADHLLSLGHRRFCFVSVRRTFGPVVVHPAGKGRVPITSGFAYDHERLGGFAQGLAEAGLALDEVPVIETTPGDPLAGSAAFDHAPGATAILTMSDWQALTVLDEALRRGIRVPDDVSVTGFDGTAESGRTTPPLTTVAHDIVGKGRLAAEMVLTGATPRQVVLPVELLVRGTTAPPRQ